MGPCWSCGNVFQFHPHKVPSIVVGGERQPLCQECVDRANVLRREQGQPLIVPMAGAYDATEEGEL